MLTISEYIKSKEELTLVPFMSAYKTILMLIEDGIVERGAFENVGKE